MGHRSILSPLFVLLVIFLSASCLFALPTRTLAASGLPSQFTGTYFYSHDYDDPLDYNPNGYHLKINGGRLVFQLSQNRGYELLTKHLDFHFHSYIEVILPEFHHYSLQTVDQVPDGDCTGSMGYDGSALNLVIYIPLKQTERLYVNDELNYEGITSTGYTVRTSIPARIVGRQALAKLDKSTTDPIDGDTREYASFVGNIPNSPPLLSAPQATPVSASSGQGSINLSVQAADDFGVRSASAKIAAPDGTSTTRALTRISGDVRSGRWATPYPTPRNSSTLPQIYQVTFTGIDSDGAQGGTTPPVSFTVAPPLVRATIQGRVQFEKIPVTEQGLDFGGKRMLPAVGILVEAVNASTEGVIKESVTDTAGKYKISLDSVPQGAIYLRVLAKCENATVVYPDDNTNVHGASDANFTVDQPVIVKDLDIYDAYRGSGPFNILDVIRRANQLIRSVNPNATFKDIRIRWSARNTQGTYFDSVENTASVKGVRDVDSDEFDDTVIGHEYGHFVLDNFSRDDLNNPSSGETGLSGEHRPTDVEDPRLSRSEGWATFFGCAVNNQSRKINSYGIQGRETLIQNLADASISGSSGGYTSEFSVASSLWNTWDKNSGGLGLGFAPIWRALTTMSKTPWPNYLTTFYDTLVTQTPVNYGDLQEMLQARSIDYFPGQVPSVLKPFPTPAKVGATLAGTFDSSMGRHNLLSSAALYSFSLTKTKTIKLKLEITSIQAPAPSSIYVVIWDRRGDRPADRNKKPLATATLRQPLRMKNISLTKVLKRGDYAVEIRSWTKIFDQEGALERVDGDKGAFSLSLRTGNTR